MAWQDRFFCRDFDSTKIPSMESINGVVDIIEYIPSQILDNDHYWFLLEYDNADHVKLKKWLVDNIYYHSEMFNVDTGDTEEEHFAVVLDAPYVLFAGIRKKTDEVVDKEKSDNEFNIMKTNVHLSAGAILGKIVDSNLHSAIIGCTHGMRLDSNKNHNTKRLEFRKLMAKIFPETTGWCLEPSISICIGWGHNHSNKKTSGQIIERHGYKWKNYKNNHKSPNLIRSEKN